MKKTLISLDPEPKGLIDRIPEENDGKTIIGIITSSNNSHVNKALIEVLTFMYEHDINEVLDNYHFLFTGGTFDRVFNETTYGDGETVEPLSGDAANFYKQRSTRLPGYEQGGVDLLSYLISQRVVHIVFPILDSITRNFSNVELDALLRLCELWSIKVMMNRASIIEWFLEGAHLDVEFAKQSIPIDISMKSTGNKLEYIEKTTPPFLISNPNSEFLESEKITEHIVQNRKGLTIALVADQNVQNRLVDFVIDYEKKFDNYFDQILTVSSLGKLLEEKVELTKTKIIKFHNPEKGGYIEIATEFLFGKCDAMIFFTDRETSDRITNNDFKVLFGAAQIRKDDIRMYTNEYHARSWLSRAFV